MVVAQTIVIGVVVGLYVVPVSVYLVYRAGKWIVHRWRVRKHRTMRKDGTSVRNRRGSSAASSYSALFAHETEEDEKHQQENSPLLKKPFVDRTTTATTTASLPLSPQQLAVQLEVNSVLAASQSLSHSRSHSDVSSSSVKRRRSVNNTLHRRARYSQDGCSTSDEERDSARSYDSLASRDVDVVGSRRRVYRPRTNQRMLNRRKTQNRASKRRHRGGESEREWRMPSPSADISEALGSSVSESQRSTQSIGDRVLRRHALLYGGLDTM